ncbi:gag-polypeptide of LTR copia-type [Phytophthora infestans]|uniref:Gag-polypeptide of LTR copia-type n=1 Tax=Phytophthora infestans TaxID=4787 RepID=A0A8S9TLQ5_PHYIN|nr:gag-polypeptide of LTR copia-type [Phytophthora infestans]
MSTSSGGQQQPAVGQQQNQQQQNAQQQGAYGGARTRRVCGSKPPKYTEAGGFDLYHAQIEGYLAQHGCWQVVSGNAVDDPNDPQWIERNQYARCALLFGMLPKDSKKVCRMATAREMWTSFEQDKTKRAYASEIRLRRDLYAAKFTPGDDMEKYLERLDDLRRQLANMNAEVTDNEMVNIVLQGVVDSHRNVVRMFNRNNNGGVVPDLATVVNVLLGEAETDRACAANANNQVETVPVTKVMSQRPAIQNTKKRFSKKGGSGKKVTQENRKCFFCKKKGHLRADCYGWKALQKKNGSSSDDTADHEGREATSMRMVWSGELGDTDNPPVAIRMA